MICPSCSKPEPQEWCWDGSNDCPMGKPPRYGQDVTPTGAQRAPSPFEQELEHLINRHSVENESDTPDFILARYLRLCLDAYNVAVRQRDRWYTFRPWARGPLEERVTAASKLARATMFISDVVATERLTAFRFAEAQAVLEFLQDQETRSDE